MERKFSRIPLATPTPITEPLAARSSGACNLVAVFAALLTIVSNVSVLAETTPIPLPSPTACPADEEIVQTVVEGKSECIPSEWLELCALLPTAIPMPADVEDMFNGSRNPQESVPPLSLPVDSTDTSVRGESLKDLVVNACSTPEPSNEPRLEASESGTPIPSSPPSIGSVDPQCLCSALAAVAQTATPTPTGNQQSTATPDPSATAASQTPAPVASVQVSVPPPPSGSPSPTKTPEPFKTSAETPSPMPTAPTLVTISVTVPVPPGTTPPTTVVTAIASVTGTTTATNTPSKVETAPPPSGSPSPTKTPEPFKTSAETPSPMPTAPTLVTISVTVPAPPGTTPPTTVVTATASVTGTATATNTPSKVETAISTPRILPTKIPDGPLGYHTYISSLYSRQAAKNNAEENYSEDAAVDDFVDLVRNEISSDTQPLVSDDLVLQTTRYYELEKEFNARFTWFPVREAAHPQYFQQSSYETQNQNCRNGIGPASAPRVRLLRVSEWHYFKDYLKVRLVEGFPSKDWTRCFFLDTAMQGQFIQVCIAGNKTVTYKDADLGTWSGGLCVKPNKLEGEDKYELFIEPIKRRHNDIDKYDLSADQKREWLKLTGDPGGSTIMEREGLLTFGFRQAGSPLHDTDKYGAWKTYVAFYIKTFGSGQPLLDRFERQGLLDRNSHTKLCDEAKRIENRQTTDLIWQDLYTLFLGVYTTTNCTEAWIEEYISGVIVNITAPSFTENLKTRGEIVKYVNACTSRVFPVIIGEKGGAAYCTAEGVLMFLPWVGTLVSFENFVNTCAAKDCFGHEAAIELAVTAVSGVFDVVGAGAAVKIARFGGAKLLKVGRAFSRNPSRFARVVMAHTTRSIARTFARIPTPSRVLDAAIASKSPMAGNAAYYAARDRLVKTMKDVIGDVDDADEAVKLLQAKGFVAHTVELKTTLNLVPGKVIEITDMSPQAAKEWPRIKTLLDAFRSGGRSGREIPFKLYIDVSRMSSAAVGGWFDPALKAVLIRPQSLTKRGRTDVTLIHELDHATRYIKTLLGSTSSWFAFIEGPLGRRMAGIGTYGKGMCLDEVKAFQKSLQARINELTEIMRKHDDLAKATMDDLLEHQYEIYAAKIEPLFHELNFHASFASDLIEYAQKLKNIRAGKGGTITYAHHTELVMALPKWEARLPDADMYYAVIKAQDGTVSVIPLSYGTNVLDQVEIKIAQKAISPEAAEKAVLEGLLDSKLDKWATDGAAMKKVLDPVMHETMGTFLPRPEWLEMNLRQLETGLNEVVRALKGASKEAFERRFIP